MTEPIPPLPPRKSALNEFYESNKTLLDRLLVLIITAILSYFGFDKLGSIEQKQDKNLVVVEQTKDVATDTRLDAKKVVVNALDDENDKLELKQLEAANQQVQREMK